MGMYTEIFFRAEVDDEAWEVLRALDAAEDRRWPDHPFFKTERFDVITRGGSYYFPQGQHSQFVRDDSPSARGAWVSFRANLKNYDDEIEKFFDWVAPHCRAYRSDRTFLGYSLYEESDTPTLFFKEGDGGLER